MTAGSMIYRSVHKTIPDVPTHTAHMPVSCSLGSNLTRQAPINHRSQLRPPTANLFALNFSSIENHHHRAVEKSTHRLPTKVTCCQFITRQSVTMRVIAKARRVCISLNSIKRRESKLIFRCTYETRPIES